jgi:hypothetical protein
MPGSLLQVLEELYSTLENFAPTHFLGDKEGFQVFVGPRAVKGSAADPFCLRYMNQQT